MPRRPVTGNVDFTAVKEAAWIGLPFHWDSTVFGILPEADPSLLITAAVTIIPIALATMIEHIGDMSAISSTVGRNYIANPGLHRTLLGDGLATILASLFGAPANTTYGENTGVLSLTKVYDPRVIRLAAIFAVILSFSPEGGGCDYRNAGGDHGRCFPRSLRYDFRCRRPKSDRK